MSQSQHDQRDRAKPAHLLVGRKCSNEPCRHTHQHDGGDQGSPAPNAVTDVAKDDRSERANKERDGVGRKRCEDSADGAQWFEEEGRREERCQPCVNVLVVGLERGSHEGGNGYLARLLRSDGGMGRGGHGHLPK